MLAGCRQATTQLQSNEAPGATKKAIRVSTENADAAEPSIAAAPGGGVYVAWVNHREGKEADVMLARFSGDGEMSGPVVRVNPAAGMATSWRGDPPTLVVGPDNTVFVGWTARAVSESGHATDVDLSVSHDGGATFALPIKINDDVKPVDHGMHSLAVGPDGRVYLAWLDDRNVVAAPAKDMKMSGTTSGHHVESNRELFMASSVDGGRTFTVNQRVATEVCPCCKTAMAVGSDGVLYLSWRQVLPGDLRHIAVASSADQAKTFSPPKIVSDDQWVLAGCPVSGPALSFASDGELCVAWYSAGKNGETGLYWAQSGDQGKSFGPRTLIAAGTTRGAPVLAGEGKSLAAVWESSKTNIPTIMTAQLTNGNSVAEQFAVDGELPAAIQTAKRLYIAYIGKSGHSQDIWLTSIPR